MNEIGNDRKKLSKMGINTNYLYFFRGSGYTANLACGVVILNVAPVALLQVVLATALVVVFAAYSPPAAQQATLAVIAVGRTRSPSPRLSVFSINLVSFVSLSI